MMKKSRSIKNLPENAVYDEITSPVGKLTLVATTKGLHAVLWDNDCQHSYLNSTVKKLYRCKNDKIINKTKKQLTEYFQGKRKVFDLPLVLNGTDFQMKAWKQLQKIPYSKTITYGQQAERVGNKNKARAVGLANSMNPISIIIPCHRVIGSNGRLTGFGGGLDKKAYLLALEKGNKVKTIYV